MSIKAIFRKILTEKNPLVLLRRSRMRKALKNTAPTFLCPNCIGGILFHDLGLQFRSPTVNTMMKQRDFVKFVLDPDRYLARELEFFDHPEYDFPCAKLDDVTVHFTHYHTEAEAREKWKNRCARIDRENLFVFLTERDGLTEEEIRSLSGIRARGLVVFTAKSYPDIPYALQIPKYEPNGEVGNILEKSWLDGSREYEKYFDFVKWFNEADGSFDVTPYKKKVKS